MDNAQKAKIRNTARIIHWVMQLLLIVALILTATVRWSWHAYRDTMSRIVQDEPLLAANGLLMGEFSRFFFLRGQKLLPYLPPSQVFERETWARAIAEELDQSVAVFVRDNRGLTWMACPPELEGGKALVERLFCGPGEGDHVTRRECGAMKVTRAYSEGDTLKLRADIVGRMSDSLRWGTVFSYQDTWRAFFRNLNQQRMNLRSDDPAEILEEVIQLPCTYARDDLPKLRAFVEDEELFASAGLDTTRHRYVFETDGLRLEYYGTERTALQAKIFNRPFVSWRPVFLTLILMLVVHLYWRWIKRLTADAVSK
ncbi:hypothetical protein KKH27_00265 [bacterium]|nr:hypothetical protein [bacterium]MBU1983517.1 hypothetical protein [bacterium]